MILQEKQPRCEISKLNVVLLSGGSGKRLWPLSNEVRSKQFLKILRGPNGIHESMVQNIYRRLKALSSNLFSSASSIEVTEALNSPVTSTLASRALKNGDGACNNIIIATSQKQVSSLQTQLGFDIELSIEPYRRDTFPAIALAVSYLHDVKGVGKDEPVVVCPVDPYVEDSYFDVLSQMYFLVERNNSPLTDVADIVLMGIEPTYPSTKYGYIIPIDTTPISMVQSFKEKPDVFTAEQYIRLGAMWNGGVFVFRISYLLDKAQSMLGFSTYKKILTHYGSLPKISFDYAVVEKEPKVAVVRYRGTWKDLGTWNTLTEAMSESVSGNAIAPLSINTHVINELQIPLIALGVKDLAIAATPDGILVTDKKSSDKLKDYVADHRPMYEKRTWGEYKVLDIFSNPAHTHNDAAGHVVETFQVQDSVKKSPEKKFINARNCKNTLTKHLVIKSNEHISYQLHRHRSEVWTFISGHGLLLLNGEMQRVSVGDVVIISAGMKHGIEAVGGELHIIEVQIGDEITEEDIERFDWPSISAASICKGLEGNF